jgi:tetratricopeptide (TPR) repeat protein
VEACPPSAGYRLRKFVRRNQRELTLSAAALTVLVLAASAWAWVQHLESTHAAETSERTAQVERDKAMQQAATKLRVDDTLNRANELIGARNWPEALALAKQAEGMLESARGNSPLQQRVQDLLDDLGMTARLEEIRLQQSDVKDGRFNDELDDNYTIAFRDYGLDVLALDPQEATKRILARSIRVELAVALENWAQAQKRDRPEGTWKRLLTLARAADPDPLRNQMRDAWERQDRKALELLAASDHVTALPPSTIILLANALAGPDSVEQVADLYRKARQQYPGDFWINHTLAAYLDALSPPQRDEAIRYYTAAVALRPQSPGAHLNLGATLSKKMGSQDEAIAAFREAIRLKHDFVPAYNNLGNSLLLQEKVKEAIDVLRQAIAIDPKSVGAHNNLGMALEKQDKLDEAIAAYRRAIQLDAKAAIAHNNLGAALAAQGKVAEAIAEYDQAIKIKPKYAAAYFNRALNLEKLHRPDEAIVAYRQAIQKDPGLAPAREGLEFILNNDRLQPLLAKQREFAQRGLVAEVEKLHRQVLPLLRELVQDFPKVIKYRSELGAQLNNLANRLFERGELAEARLLIEEAIVHQQVAHKADSQHATYHRFLRNHYAVLAEICVQQGDHVRAAVAAVEVPRFFPDNWTEHHLAAQRLAACTLLAQADGQLSELERQARARQYADGAKAALRKAIQRSADNADAHDTLAWFLLTCEAPLCRDTGLALELARKAIAAAPKNSRYCETLARAYGDAGQPAQAEKYLRDSLAIHVKMEPDAWTTFYIQALLGGTLLDQKKYAEAEPLLRQAYEAMKQREADIRPSARHRLTEALALLVRLYQETNQQEKAEAWRKKLKDMTSPK